VINDAVERGADPGLVMSEFDAMRRPDRLSIRIASHGLAHLFYNRNPLAAMARNMGMLSVATLPCFQSALARGGMGMSSGVVGL
jgi:2-polyprenyl-6-methoxyphenol hydroxylase-like FAD-dependent oxidoreductase